MTYRESNFDPNAGGDYGPPMRPFNWVQWTGVAFALIGVGIDLAYLGGRAGIIPKFLYEPSIGIALPFIGAALINSRRQPGTLSPETKRQRTVIILVALAVCVAVAATIFYLKGA
jgi:peptidoglycan/LPS O-acetylase OafA/YrhL